MTIHHATASKAKKLNMTLTMVNDADASHGYRATGKFVNIVEDDPKEALANAADAMVVAKESNVYVYRDSLEDDYRATKDANGTDVLIRDPDLQDLFESLEEMQPEEAEEDERGGSVVPARYKTLYKERNEDGDPTHCGDWLATTLNTLCRVKGDKGRPTTDLDAFETIATANGIDQASIDKLKTGTNGWQGRLRMTIRNRMAKLVSVKGELFIPEGTVAKYEGDKTLKAPKAWCQQNAPKPKEAKKAKKAKAKATADA